ncbi:MAG: YybH family protein [Blastocatellia bacterium]
MNRFVKTILALTLVLMVALANVVEAKAPARRAQAADAEFKKLIVDYYAAWSQLSADTPAKYYAKDADLIFYDIAPMKYNSWKEYHDGVQKYFFDGADTAKLTPNLDDLKVTRRGNVAWTTLTFRLTSTPKGGGQATTLNARHTAIWERRGNQWLIVHEHISVPLPT